MKAIYAGSFDPFTLGHMSIVRRAAKMFGALSIVVGVNQAKESLFTPNERCDMIRDEIVDFRNTNVVYTDGFIGEYARIVGAGVLVRGLREGDLKEEMELADLNAKYFPELTTIFIPTEYDLRFFSSSNAKHAIQFSIMYPGGWLTGAGAGFLSPKIYELTLAKMKGKLNG